MCLSACCARSRPMLKDQVANSHQVYGSRFCSGCLRHDFFHTPWNQFISCSSDRGTWGEIVERTELRDLPVQDAQVTERVVARALVERENLEGNRLVTGLGQRTGQGDPSTNHIHDHGFVIAEG